MKYTWKKLISLSLAAVMALSLAACGQSETADDSQAANQSQEETSTPAPTPTPENGEDTSAPDASEPETARAERAAAYWWSTTPLPAIPRRWQGYIAEATGGDLFELEPVEPYSDADLNWTDENSRVTQEHEDESLWDVELATDTVDNWDSYDTVFIGYPIWWGIAAGRWTASWRPTILPAKR